MRSELSDKFVNTENPPEGIALPETRADVFFSAEAVRKDYDHYLHMLRSYDLGEILLGHLSAKKIETNTRTVGLILERVKEEDYEAAQKRLMRAAVLMDELKQECTTVAVYGRKPSLQ